MANPIVPGSIQRPQAREREPVNREPVNPEMAGMAQRLQGTVQLLAQPQPNEASLAFRSRHASQGQLPRPAPMPIVPEHRAFGLPQQQQPSFAPPLLQTAQPDYQNFWSRSAVQNGPRPTPGPDNAAADREEVDQGPIQNPHRFRRHLDLGAGPLVRNRFQSPPPPAQIAFEREPVDRD